MVAMSLALIGLVAIQVHWIRNSIALREAQFGQSLDQALVAVSDRLERLEKIEGLRGSMPGQLLGRIGGAAPDSTILLGDDGASPGDDLLEEVLRGLLASIRRSTSCNAWTRACWIPCCTRNCASAG